MSQTTCKNTNVIQKRSFWKSLFTGIDGKMAVVGVAFLIWTTIVTVGWAVISVKDAKLAELPATVVHLTLALGATKVTHRIAEANWEKILGQFFSIFKKEVPKIQKEIEKILDKPKKKGKRNE